MKKFYIANLMGVLKVTRDEFPGGTHQLQKFRFRKVLASGIHTHHQCAVGAVAMMTPLDRKVARQLLTLDWRHCQTSKAKNWWRCGISFDCGMDVRDSRIPKGGRKKLNDFLYNTKDLKWLDFYHLESSQANLDVTHRILIVGVAVLIML